jgi:hypothetical protein
LRSRSALGHGIGFGHTIEADHLRRPAIAPKGAAIQASRHDAAVLQYFLVAGRPRNAIDQHRRPPANAAHHLDHELHIGEVVIDHIGEHIDKHFGGTQYRLRALAIGQPPILAGIEIRGIDQQQVPGYLRRGHVQRRARPSGIIRRLPGARHLGQAMQQPLGHLRPGEHLRVAG